mmetsp:Transcript_38640/g.90799  ORF Transcript_38640/g.90799 Transcript_38640/m.90799 type:complete len:242 (+) Transcript_38640:246-971(+)
MNFVVFLRSGEVLRDSPCAVVVFHSNSPTLDIGKPLLSPVFTPRVTDDPVQALLVICIPTNDRDGVICHATLCSDDAGLVVQKRFGIHVACNRPPCIDLLHHGVPALNRAKLRDRCVWVSGNSHTLFAKRAASSGHVVVRACEVNTLAKILRTVLGASNIWHGCCVGNASAAFADGLDPLVGSVWFTALARACIATIEHVLHGELDVRTSRLACDLDAVLQGRDGAVGPTTSTVLGNVLVQ